MSCLFCRIAQKELSSSVIYEDDCALGFLDIHPLTEGHAVVIPKVHAENILALGRGDIGPFFSAVQNVTRLLREKLSPDGFTIGINHGKVSGQSVDHLHIHVIPRYKNDGGGSIHSIIKSRPQPLVEDTYKKLIS